MKKKILLGSLILVLASAVVFAQSVTLRSGTYKPSGIIGKGNLVLHPLSAGQRKAVLHGPDGSAVGRGTWSVEGSTLKINLTSGALTGFDTFTIINSTSFIGDNDGATYYRTGDAG